jgi:hypothetical protein
MPRYSRASGSRWPYLLLIGLFALYSMWQQRRAAQGPPARPDREPPVVEERGDLPVIRPKITPPDWLPTGDTTPEKTARITPQQRRPPAPGPDLNPKVAAPPAAFQLKEVRPGVFESPAGLVYRSGGREGHRIDHVLEHAKDDPSKPVHGVYRGDRDSILAMIDEAYRLTESRGPPTVQKEEEGSRTVYTVDMGRSVGFAGGQSGQRKGRPSLRHIRLVLEGDSVITAFPTAP